MDPYSFGLSITHNSKICSSIDINHSWPVQRRLFPTSYNNLKIYKNSLLPLYLHQQPREKQQPRNFVRVSCISISKVWFNKIRVIKDCLYVSLFKLEKSSAIWLSSSGYHTQLNMIICTTETVLLEVITGTSFPQLNKYIAKHLISWMKAQFQVLQE